MIEKFIRGKRITGKILQIECVHQKYTTNEFIYRADVEHENCGTGYFVQILNGVVSYVEPQKQSTAADYPEPVMPSVKQMMGIMSNGPNQSDVEKIVKYFKDLWYPEISSSGAVFNCGLGQVYLIEFKDAARTPCYAVIVNGVVSGYNEDFWSDADKYRLVLKQHLGMLVMEGVKILPLKSAPVPEEILEPFQKMSCVKPSTIDSVVELYEKEIDALKAALEKTRNDYADSLGQEKALRIVAECKLYAIKDILSGKKETAETPGDLTPEECMIDQDNESILNSDSVSSFIGGIPDKPFTCKINAALIG